MAACSVHTSNIHLSVLLTVERCQIVRKGELIRVIVENMVSVFGKDCLSKGNEVWSR